MSTRLHKDRVEHSLLPGQVWFGQAPAQVSTLLGSCVAITLWHPPSKQGGMCHFMLPERPPTQSRAGLGLDGRYGDEALRLLLRCAERAGCPVAECEFKLFGGGHMFDRESSLTPLSMSVNARNVEQALWLTQRHGLHVTAEHLGGEGHRQIRFDLNNGDVWVRFRPPDEKEASCT